MDNVKITFPDGSIIEVKKGTQIKELLKNIPQRIAKETLCAKLNDTLLDLSAPIETDGNIKFITFNDTVGKSLYWHSSSHIMAQAVKDIFPDVKIAIGPSIDEGFYYDFDIQKPFTPEDLNKITERIKEIIKGNHPFEKSVLSKDEALKLFKDEPYKIELIKDIPDETVTIYKHDTFIDLCRGPHLPSTGYVKAIKLLSVAGAYWRGLETNQMLQRIYGVSYPTENELTEHTKRIEEALKRDHRKLGQELDLFGFSDEIGPGLVLWYPKGAMVRKLIEDFWRSEHLKRGYSLLFTPHIARFKLWETSGHSGFYAENMFPTMDIEGSPYQLKPMNCPFHIIIYKKKLHSYREFPIRYAELGNVYRYERSGVLHGLMRVRGFTQDDAHIFCRERDLENEIRSLISFTFFMLRKFGFEDFDVFLSTRPENYIGSIDNWDLATESLKNALEKENVQYRIDPGEGVFYGPKIDLKIRDALKRTWQCSTIQVDFNLPERFEVKYMDSDGAFKRPIMIHRALLGSLERFLGVLLEYHAGDFPLWLTPTQIVVLPLTDKESDYAKGIYEKLLHNGFRAEFDSRPDKINYRIREWEIQKIPYMVVIGGREVESGNIAIRKHKIGQIGEMNFEEFLEHLRKEL